MESLAPVIFSQTWVHERHLRMFQFSFALLLPLWKMLFPLWKLMEATPTNMVIFHWVSANL